MREELLGPKVEGVACAVVQELNEENEKIYNVYLVNLREDIMEGIMVTSQGYGNNVSTGETIRTSKLRHQIEVLPPNDAAKIEPIIEEVFGLANEYWVSFWVDENLYDKKFVFVAESISEKNMKMLPVIGKMGVMIK